MPRDVWVLGFVSLLMDVSSEMIHGLLPVFMISELHAGALAVGLVEGVAEATAMICKVFSGALSDWLGKRKELAVLGYGLAAATKPFFALATSVEWVLGARFTDRVGKGLRGAPRDALIADVTPAELRGAAYGLRQSLDTVGAFVGPLLAIVLMLAWHGAFRRVFWFAVFPGVLSVTLLAFGVRESSPPARKSAKSPIGGEELARLGSAYWWIVALGAIFSLARFSEAFLILRARQSGLSDAFAPAVLVLMNVVFALSAYPAGRLADRIPHRAVLASAILALMGSQVILATTGGLAAVAVGIALWGLHLGLSQGLFSAMVASVAPPDLRGTAFGFFNLASGAAILVSSPLAGLLWERFGASATFLSGLVCSALSLVLLAAE